MKTKKIVISILISMLTVLGIGVVLKTFQCDSNRNQNNMKMIKNEGTYQLDFECLSTTDSHQFDLSGNERLKVKMEVEQGDISLTIKDPSGTIIYTGNGKEINDFTVGIEESGSHTMTIKTKDATGMIQISVEL